MSKDRIRPILQAISTAFPHKDTQDALAALAELEREAAKWERLHDELYAEIASEHRRDEYGETETAAECIRRIVGERDQLRAQLDEYERAPTVAYLSIDCVGERYLIFSQPQDKDELHELIARPARKGAK